MRAALTIVSTFLIFGIVASAAEEKPLATVGSVDLKKYSGRWFEIARIPNRFQEKCAGQVSADYTLREDRTIQVVNRCTDKKDGKTTVAEGVGRVAKEGAQSNAVLEVRFAPAILSFLPPVWGDYRIISLGPNYEHAMVGSKDRKYLWILSRQPTLTGEVYKTLLAEAAAKGFDTATVVLTKQ